MKYSENGITGKTYSNKFIDIDTYDNLSPPLHPTIHTPHPPQPGEANLDRYSCHEHLSILLLSYSLHNILQ